MILVREESRIMNLEWRIENQKAKRNGFYDKYRLIEDRPPYGSANLASFCP